MPQIGPYSRAPALAKLDGRTREARLLRDVRADLLAHVGGRPSSTQRQLIERAAWLSLRVAQLDTKLAAGEAFSDHDSRTYLAWSNSLARCLRMLGLGQPLANRPQQPARSLRDHIREREAPGTGGPPGGSDDPPRGGLPGRASENRHG